MRWEEFYVNGVGLGQVVIVIVVWVAVVFNQDGFDAKRRLVFPLVVH